MLQRHYRQGIIWVCALTGFLLAASALVVALDLDRTVSAFFYSRTDAWYLGKRQPWRLLYEYGTLPGLALALGSLIGYLVCRLRNLSRRWRHGFLVVVLTTVIGAGGLVNALLKPYWGRPRPSQTVEFGGTLTYRPFYAPGEPGRGKSFPCGHCTMGFVFLSLLCFRRTAPALAWSGAAAGILLGVLLSAARIVQGGHYLSDTLWSMGIICLVAVCLHFFVFRLPAAGDETAAPISRKTRALMIGGVLLALLVMVGAFLTRRPYYNVRQFPFALPETAAQLAVITNVPLEQQRVVYKDIPRPRLVLHSHGFGRPSSVRHVRFAIGEQDAGLVIRADMSRSGFFSELDHQVEVWLPERFAHRIDTTFSVAPAPASVDAEALHP